MKRNFARLALLVLAAGALTLTIPAQSKSNIEETDKFSDKTDSLKFEFSMAESSKTASFQVKVKMQSGRVEWKLRDPNGNVRLVGHGTGGTITGKSGNLKPIAGVWTFQLELIDATGAYTINWNSR